MASGSTVCEFGFWIGRLAGLCAVLWAPAGSPAQQVVAQPRTGAQHPVVTCVSCHDQARSQPGTSMAHALETVEKCATLTAHPLLTFKAGKYSYRIERRGDQSIYSVSNGAETLTMPVRWVMGASSAIGQTFILEKDGELYESQVSFFAERDGLDITMGHEAAPANLVEAAGRRMPLEDRLRCFGCHATAATEKSQLTLDKMIPGVQCERCHGSAEKHLEGMSKGDPQPAPMRDLSKLSTEQVFDFCGQCHRTWEDVAAQGKLDITDIRFQPYRLTGSKCYDADDPRISCIACHDPHHEVDKKTTDYDSKCQACHAGGKPRAGRCKVASSRCASCHMPKIELPGAHHKFSDHRIRIVKANEAYPG